VWVVYLDSSRIFDNRRVGVYRYCVVVGDRRRSCRIRVLVRDALRGDVGYVWDILITTFLQSGRHSHRKKRMRGSTKSGVVGRQCDRRHRSVTGWRKIFGEKRGGSDIRKRSSLEIDMSKTESQAHYAQADKDDWQTPPALLANIKAALGDIDLDPCPGKDTYIGRMNYYEHDGYDGRAEAWFGRVFVNPPFSKKKRWTEKVVEEYLSGRTDVILLVTPDSTDVQSWFHGDIVPHADYVWFSEGRVSYIDPETGKTAGSPTFGTAISVFVNDDYDLPVELLDFFSETGWLVEEVSR